MRQPSLDARLVETLSGPDVPDVFPSCGSMLWCLLSSTGSPRREFPRFTGRTRQCDSLPALPPRFVSFAQRYHPSVPHSLPGARDASPRAWVLVSGPPTANRRWRRQGLPRFLEDPNARMPCSKTPAGPRRLAFRTLRCCLPHVSPRRLPRLVSFRDSIARPTCALCTLRSSSHPETTQHSVPVGGQPLPGRDGYLLGPSARFQAAT
jgi:hypothetical protein